MHVVALEKAGLSGVSGHAIIAPYGQRKITPPPFSERDFEYSFRTCIVPSDDRIGRRTDDQGKSMAGDSRPI